MPKENKLPEDVEIIYRTLNRFLENNAKKDGESGFHSFLGMSIMTILKLDASRLAESSYPGFDECEFLDPLLSFLKDYRNKKVETLKKE